MKHVVLYSGGLDSLITVAYVKQQMETGDSLELVYIPLGHRYQQEEARAVMLTHPETVFLRGLKEFGAVHEDKEAFIPDRNAYLCLLAAQRIPCGLPGTIWLTVQKDEMSIPDRSPEFFQCMSDLLFSLGKNASVSTPWWAFDKADMVSWYLSLDGGTIEALKTTHSCYRPGVAPCGDCSACIRRYIAMKLNSIEEAYEIDPKSSKTAAVYIQRAKEGIYSEERSRKTLKALEG